MPRRTLQDLQNSRIPTALKLCGTDPRFVQFLNEALEALIQSGAFWGLFVRYRAQVTNGLLVWPRGIAAILAGAICNNPIKTRSMAWEFVEMGMGIQTSTAATPTGSSNCCGSTCFFSNSDLLDRGNTPVQTPISGPTSKLKLYCDLAVDAAAPVLVLGEDANGNLIRTIQGGVYADGEVIFPSVAGTLSANIFTVVTGVQKGITNGPIRAYAFDTATSLQTAIAVWDYDDPNPLYRVSYIPSLDSQNPSSNPVTVDVLVKLEFVPLRQPTDFALIGNVPALKAMCLALNDAEKESDPIRRQQVVAGGLQLAKMFLENELRHYGGSPEEILQVQGLSGPTNEVIENFV